MTWSIILIVEILPQAHSLRNEISTNKTWAEALLFLCGAKTRKPNVILILSVLSTTKAHEIMLLNY